MNTKSKRSEAQVTPDTLVRVQRAAVLQGNSVPEFVVAAADKVAHRALIDVSTARTSS